MLIDTHCHLAAEEFDADRAAVIERAKAAGVECAVVVGETDRDNERVLELAAGEPFFRPAAGLHPEHADPEMAARCLEFVRAHAPRLAAIGEVGLDYFRAQDDAARRIQVAVFERFIGLSLETGLCLSVHSRSAGHYAVDCLIENGRPRAVLHAFDGKFRYAEKGVEAGFLFSIPPSIVRSRQKQDLARVLPLGALLLESDAPVLGPNREERNEPAFIAAALQSIAAIKGVDPAEVARVTTANARRLFRL